MRLLIDNCVPDQLMAYFTARGHDVTHVRDCLPLETTDPTIAKLSIELGSVVVTWNRRHFKRLADRAHYSALRLLLFDCPESKGQRKAEAFIDLIEFEFEQSERRSDKRFVIEVQDSSLRIERSLRPESPRRKAYGNSHTI
ncbi:MAG: hypothetical protein EPO21_12935 [Chloroflexota bacterium]|nr:MAG: hypothetical protein EPO21_12935 [Chloroflexota bacterium]